MLILMSLETIGNFKRKKETRRKYPHFLHYVTLDHRRHYYY